MSAESGEQYTIPNVAQETGIPAHQIYYAITRGIFIPEGPKVGEGRRGRKAYTLSPEQFELVKRTAGLVSIGVTFYFALRAVQAGWKPPSDLAI